MSITLRQIEWTAGFLEGEGSFDCQKAPRVTASQVQYEPLQRLEKYFGGKSRLEIARSGNPNHSNIYYWYISGIRAAALMMTLFVLMSSKRKMQIIKSLTQWKSIPVQNRFKTHCKHGHEFSRDNTYIAIKGTSKSRYCKMCSYLRNIQYRKVIRSDTKRQCALNLK